MEIHHDSNLGVYNVGCFIVIILSLGFIAILTSYYDVLARREPNQKDLFSVQQKSNFNPNDSLTRVSNLSKSDEGAQAGSLIMLEKNTFEAETIKKYYIIVGSFINSDNAKLEAQKYQNLGYQTSIIKKTNSNGNRVEMVSIITFSGYYETVKCQRELISKAGYQTWIYSE